VTTLGGADATRRSNVVNNETTGLHILIRKCAGGDQQAQTDLYLCVSQRLIQYVLNRYGNRLIEEDAWDIMQHTVLQMYIHAGHFEGVHDKASAWNWAYSIARNQALKRIKSYSRMVPILETVQENPDQEKLEDEDALFKDSNLKNNSPCLDHELELQVINRLAWQAACECYKELSPREREILDLRFVNDSTLEEIAQIYHIQKPRVHQLLVAIFIKMRKAAKLVDYDQFRNQ
jgi:RNA polymerase sigma factor (sigma-70 family)